MEECFLLHLCLCATVEICCVFASKQRAWYVTFYIHSIVAKHQLDINVTVATVPSVGQFTVALRSHKRRRNGNQVPGDITGSPCS
jgi:hypothetical protein